MMRDSVTSLVTPSLRFHQIQKSSVLVQESVSLARASCSFLCDEEGTGLVVDRLEVVPFTKLILPLDLCEGRHR